MNTSIDQQVSQTALDAAASAIQLRSLHKHFRDANRQPIRAVDGIDLDIKRGEIVALLGSNGAGKTTALDVMLGLTQPTSGTVKVLGGKPRTAISRGNIAAVLQTGGLLQDLRVDETVRLIAGMYDHHLDVVDAMRRAGIEHIAKRRVSKCSGGEQQRLRFALALLPEPEVLILDEPTAGMDVNARAEFWATMTEEAHAGRTIIFATHYLEEAEKFAQRIVMMNAGKIVADGTVDAIRKVAGKRRVSVTWPDASETDIAALPAHEIAYRSGDQITFQAADSDAFARALLTSTPARDLFIENASLDEAFSRLTHEDGQHQTPSETPLVIEDGSLK